MSLKKQGLMVLMAAALVALPASGGGKKKSNGSTDNVETTASGPVTLWTDPGDIASRNLYYGPGGEKHAPHGRFTFESEDMDGTNPKFTVRDDDGVKWKVKLGAEARPETVASRLVWAVGYATNEDYFVAELHVQGMQRLKRGQKLVLPGGTVLNVRLKRHLKGEEKVGEWPWRKDPFSGTREYNGLRVMMALINNWDLKDQNNTIYKEKDAGEVYMVSDLGSSFGTASATQPHEKAKGNLRSYEHSRFIVKVRPEFIDFENPGNPSFKYWVNPKECLSRRGLRWIGRNIPRSDVEWIGGLLARLTPEQIQDAFRAAGYSPEQVNGFSRVVEQRIAELSALSQETTSED
jgi:hypothetical protein